MENPTGKKVRVKREYYALYLEKERVPMIVKEYKISDLQDMETEVFYFEEYPDYPFMAHHFEQVPEETT